MESLSPSALPPSHPSLMTGAVFWSLCRVVDALQHVQATHQYLSYIRLFTDIS